MAQTFGKLASRYAKALLKATRAMIGEAGINDVSIAMAGELGEFSRAWKSDPQLSYYLLSPMYPEEQRKQALLAVAQSCGLQELSRKFLAVIFERNRLVALPEIIEAFAELAKRQAGLVPVEIKIAREIDSAEHSNIEQRLQSKITGKAVFSWQIKPELLGGMIVVYDGKILDGSVSGRLARLAEDLTA
ncbi:MAG: ATP synthase F1 subunit delta [Deltaproteobacteria bacterium]|nr:ATP synthase F1 subunit delta [Deltaproteobacteria bacterium]